MDSGPMDSGGESSAADRLYFDFMIEADPRDLDALDRLCAQHPEHAERFREINTELCTQLAPFAPRPPRPAGEPAQGPPVLEVKGLKFAAGRYVILGQIGVGGMGVVHRVWDPQLQRMLALKEVRHCKRQGLTPAEEDELQSGLLHRFEREAQLTARLDHPGVVPIHEFGKDEQGGRYFTMRLVEGRELTQLMLAARRGEPQWNLTRIVNVLVKVCETLAFAHSKGVIHRDLKPDNIMVGAFGETYVMDWGLAKSLRDPADPVPAPLPREPADLWDPENTHPRLEEVATSTGLREMLLPSGSSHRNAAEETLDGSVLGTAWYMPPEQAAGKLDQVNERADIYSVGAMLYEVLTGRRPYAHAAPRSRKDLLAAVLAGPPARVGVLDPQAPAELVSICEKAMARRAEDRYAGMQQLCDDLRAYLENRVVLAHRTGLGVEFRKWVSRNRGLSTGIGLAVVVSIVSLFGFLLLQAAANRALSIAHEDTEQERERTEAIALIRQAELERRTNPGLSLQLAQQGQPLQPGIAGNSAIWSAVAELREIQASQLHTGEILALRVSRDRRFAATSGEDGLTIVWDLEQRKARHLLCQHTKEVGALDFSPDGQRLATGGQDGRICLWSVETGALEQTLTGPPGRVASVEFSRSENRLISFGGDNTLRIWALAGGETRLVDFDSPPRSVRLAAEGRIVVQVEGQRDLEVYRETEPGREWIPVESPILPDSLRISDDGSQLACLLGGLIDRPAIWDFERGTWIDPGGNPPGFVPSSVDFAPQGGLLIGGRNGQVAAWDESSGWSVDGRLNRQSSVTKIVANETGSLWAVAREDQSLVLLDREHLEDAAIPIAQGVWNRFGFDLRGGLTTGCSVGVVRFFAPTCRFRDSTRVAKKFGNPKLSFSKDGQRLLAFTEHAARLISIPEMKVLRTFEGDEGLLSTQFDPGGTWIAILGTKQGIRVHAAQDGQLQVENPVPGPIGMCRFADERNLVAVAPVGEPGFISVYHVLRPREVRRVELPDCSYMLLSEDGRRALGWRPDNFEVVIYDTLKGAQIGTTRAPGPLAGFPPALRMDPHGKFLVNSTDATWTILNVDTGYLVNGLEGHDSRNSQFEFSPDQETVFTWGHSPGYQQHALATGRIVKTAGGEGAGHSHMVLSPNGTWLATRGPGNSYLARVPDSTAQVLGLPADRTSQIRFSLDSKYVALDIRNGTGVKLVQVETVEGIAETQFEGAPIVQLQFSPQGEWLATLHSDGTVRLWPHPTDNRQALKTGRQFTEFELDNLQIGKVPERRNLLRELQRTRLNALLTLAARSPSGELSSFAGDQVLEILLQRHLEALGEATTLSDRLSELARVEPSDLDRLPGRRGVMALIAGVRHQQGDPSGALMDLNYALRGGELNSSLSYARWATWRFQRGSSAARLLEDWPTIQNSQNSAGDDVHWVLKTLVQRDSLRINCGDIGDHIDGEGRVWRRDCFFGGGYRFGETIGLDPVSKVPIPEHQAARLLQTERWFDAKSSASQRQYRIPVPKGRYRIEIQAAEIYLRDPDERRFDVEIEGQAIRQTFSSREVGFGSPVTRTVKTRVEDGELTIEFQPLKENPKVSTIEVWYLGG